MNGDMLDMLREERDWVLKDLKFSANTYKQDLGENVPHGAGVRESEYK